MTIDNKTAILALLAYDEAMHDKVPTIPNKLAAMKAALTAIEPRAYVPAGGSGGTGLVLNNCGAGGGGSVVPNAIEPRRYTGAGGGGGGSDGKG